jgi:hypothetical protein
MMSPKNMSTAKFTLLRVLMITVLIETAWVDSGLGQQTPGPTEVYAYTGPTDLAPIAIGQASTIPFPSTQVGNSTSISLLLTNKNTGSITVSKITVSGPGFGPPTAAPVEILSGATGAFTITFTPASAGPATGRITLQVGQTPVFFLLSGSGVAPNFIFSYIINAGGNQTGIDDGGTIVFPQTAASASTSATIIIQNTGSGPGTINSVLATGAGFGISALPLLPVTVAPNNDLRFNVVFSPTSRDNVRGTLGVTYSQSSKTSASKTFGLQGQGTGSFLTYESITESGATTIKPDDTITLPSTAVGASASSTIRIRNTGNAEGRITAVTIVGTAFAVSELVPLPVTVPPGGAVTFKLTFSPKESGPATAKLLIDGVLFNLSAAGLGAKLSLTVRIGTTTTPVANEGTVIFPNTSIGTKSSAVLQVSNTGNLATTVNAVNLTGAGFVFAETPAAPRQIAPGEALNISVDFAPQITGTITGVLQVEDQTINLRGIGGAPPPMPAVTFTGLAGSADPLQQPSLGLALASPYPLDITGKLALGFTSDSFVDDPAMQFASGGRSVDFRIPANTTEALFGQTAKVVQFQTGTVAGVITLSASFATGSVDLTPKPAPVQPVLISGQTPQLRNLQIGARTASSFEVLLTGFSTLRSVIGITLTFVAAPGSNLQTTSVPINVETPFSAWYQSAPARSVGSQFTVSITITVVGDINAVQSLSAIATNAKGDSPPLSLNLR